MVEIPGGQGSEISLAVRLLAERCLVAFMAIVKKGTHVRIDESLAHNQSVFIFYTL